MTVSYRASTSRPLVLANKLRRDRLALAWSPGKGEWGETPLPPSVFAGATPVVLDSVSDYWDERGPDKWPDERLVPNYRLPWRYVWAEWVDKLAGGGRAGVLLREWELKPGASPSGFCAALLNVEHSSQEKFRTFDRPGVSHVISASVFAHLPQLDRVTVFPPLLWATDNAGSGKVGADAGTDVVSVSPDPRITRELWQMLGVWRLFTAWLQVRNVGVADVDLDRAARRRGERQSIRDGGPPPFVRYKTLALNLPCAAADGGTSSRRGPSSPVPFHLVRGHLADYRNGKGLFGRWRNVVWVPMHTRGFQKVGAVAKTYTAKMDGAA